MHSWKRLGITLALALLFSACGGSEGNEDVQTTGGTSATGAKSPVVADFEFAFDIPNTNDTVCPVRATIFTDLSEGSPDRWLWEFPDGTTTETQSPTIEDEINGIVRLTVWLGPESSIVEKAVRNDVLC